MRLGFIQVAMISFVMWLQHVASINAQTSPSKEAQAIKDFEFQGFKFGADLDSFKQKFGDKLILIEKRSDSKNGVSVYGIVENFEGFDLCFLWFCDGKLFQIRLNYEPSTVDKIGGWETVIEKVVEKFGKPSPKSKGTDAKAEDEIAEFHWVFPDVHRFISIDVSKKDMNVEFTDTEAYEKWQERKKKSAKVGF